MAIAPGYLLIMAHNVCSQVKTKLSSKYLPLKSPYTILFLPEFNYIIKYEFMLGKWTIFNFLENLIYEYYIYLHNSIPLSTYSNSQFAPIHSEGIFYIYICSPLISFSVVGVVRICLEFTPSDWLTYQVLIFLLSETPTYCLVFFF